MHPALGPGKQTLEGGEIDPLSFLEAQGRQWAGEVNRWTVDDDLGA